MLLHPRGVYSRGVCTCLLIKTGNDYCNIYIYIYIYTGICIYIYIYIYIIYAVYIYIYI